MASPFSLAKFKEFGIKLWIGTLHGDWDACLIHEAVNASGNGSVLAGGFIVYTICDFHLVTIIGDELCVDDYSLVEGYGTSVFYGLRNYWGTDFHIKHLLKAKAHLLHKVHSGILHPIGIVGGVDDSLLIRFVIFGVMLKRGNFYLPFSTCYFNFLF